MNAEKEQYQRNLSLNDLLFVGLGFIIGAGIFSLLPFIIKYSKGISWMSFVSRWIYMYSRRYELC